MKPFHPRWFVLIPLLFASTPKAEATYLLPPSTGTDVPYSIQTKALLKRLFNNSRIVGGQVVALKDQPGRHFNGNYIDVGDLGGVKKGDVFALFSPLGDPVGLLRVTETQRYVSSFEFIELTVDPSENLIAKKVTEEVKLRLPERLRIFPDMGKFKSKRTASRGKTKPTSSASQTPLPPLPGESSGASLPPLPGESSNSLPALPGEGTGELPPAPEMDMSPGGTGLPPLPMGMEPLPGGDAGLPPLPDGTSDGGLPPMEGESSLPPLDPSAGLPPSGSDMSDLPPMPDAGMPGLPGEGMTDPSSNNLPPMEDPSLPPMDGGLPPLPGGDPALDGSLPPMGMDQTLPPLSDPMGLPPSDSNLPPIPDAEMGTSDAGDLPPLSGLPDAPSPLVGSDPSSDMALPPPSLDGGLPPSPEDNSLAPPSLADLPSEPGLTPFDPGLPASASDPALPPMDQDPMMAGLAPPDATSDIPLPPMVDASLPPTPDMGGSDLPPVDLAALPPEPVGLPSVDSGLGMDQAGLPPMDGLPPDNASTDLPGLDALPPSFEDPVPGSAPAGSGHAARLGLPALPQGVKGGFNQDLPTLAGS